jgi:hypothetical protein
MFGTAVFGFYHFNYFNTPGTSAPDLPLFYTESAMKSSVFVTFLRILFVDPEKSIQDWR